MPQSYSFCLRHYVAQLMRCKRLREIEVSTTWAYRCAFNKSTRLLVFYPAGVVKSKAGLQNAWLQDNAHLSFKSSLKFLFYLAWNHMGNVTVPRQWYAFPVLILPPTTPSTSLPFLSKAGRTHSFSFISYSFDSPFFSFLFLSKGWAKKSTGKGEHYCSEKTPR